MALVPSKTSNVLVAFASNIVTWRGGSFQVSAFNSRQDTVAWRLQCNPYRLIEVSYQKRFRKQRCLERAVVSDQDM